MDNMLSTIGQELYEAVDKAEDSVRLASPFLSKRVAKDLAASAKRSKARWTLITALNAQAIRSGFLSSHGLRTLVENGVRVLNLPGLHAKVYVADTRFGLVGSGNLTSTGLGLDGRGNVELSVRLQGESLEQVASKFATWEESASRVDLAMIAEFEEAASRLPTDTVVQNPELSPAGASHPSLLQLHRDAQERPTRLWVKAETSRARPDVWTRKDWFASGGKGTPTFAPGDLVLIYATESRACYAVVEVTSEATYDPAFMAAQGVPEGHPEQWPWLSRTKTRLLASEETFVPLSEIGVSPHGLQNGRTRIQLPDFLLATHLMAEA